jgi:hypothetical protein
MCKVGSYTYDKKDILGKGSFGSVYLGLSEKGEKVAV